eukprot:CAMPEP_0117830616 /NCGR_PEP_ID=MMETSP0949-20121206/8623_1 /TAXON_ID=44440 /ORGANISM="Chattonella subsalsa, Strain CCMP2191" /LENGTH=77 /DNA_ID=CAMNT_0005671703 /DNA_START=83 /DNA_END=316 /DNA_ORIENTATION=-
MAHASLQSALQEELHEASNFGQGSEKNGRDAAEQKLAVLSEQLLVQGPLLTVASTAPFQDKLQEVYEKVAHIFQPSP